MKAFLRWASAALAVMVASAACADDYPSKPVRFIVSLGAGSSTDVLARKVAKLLEAEWKQTVFVENRPGSGGVIANEFVARQPADGHTLLVTGSSLVLAPLIMKNAHYDAKNDFIPAAKIATLRIVLATNMAVPATTLKDFTRYSREHPGKLNYGGLGRSSAIDTGIEVLKRGLGMDVTPVPYPGASEHITALLRNDIQLVWGGSALLSAQQQSGKIRIIAAVADHRLPDLPDVPTVVEEGYKGFIPTIWVGVIARTGTPQAILDKINATVNRVLARPDVVDDFGRSLGMDVAPLSIEKFSKDVDTEAAFWTETFKSLKIEPQ